MARKNRLKQVLILWFCMALALSGAVFGVTSHSGRAANAYEWTEAETAWLEAHKGQKLKLGLDPFIGMDYYAVGDEKRGYLVDVAAILEKDLGLKFEFVDQYNWETILGMLRTGEIDVLFGANATEERKTYMSFTEALHKYPYSVYTVKQTGIRTLGDLDGKLVGFLSGDAIERQFPILYKNIRYDSQVFDDQVKGLEAVRSGQVDAFITANGGITKKYAHDYEDIEVVADLTTFTSDMTLATRLEDQVLAQIIDQVLVKRASEIDETIEKSERAYNRYILKLTPEEEAWLDEHPRIIAGAPSDYLPFDYFENGRYKGISGNYLTEVLHQIGAEVEAVPGPFDVLFEKTKAGEIHILNMAKTEEREGDFVFTKPFSEERDEIFGSRNLPYLQDIYELEDKRVAVVKGYWHEDYLKKNLSRVIIVETQDLKESLKVIAQGKADYLIENPTVANYYIDGLGYSGIIPKGTTSQDSFLYYGIPKKDAVLASILNKAMPLVRYDKIKSTALQEVPSQKNVTNTRLVNVLMLFAVAIGALTFYLFKLFHEVLDHRTQRRILEEREKLIYLDGLTGLFNRLYFNSKEPEFNLSANQQIFLMADLNGLKHINDSYGHVYGDQFICAFAEALTEVFSGETIIRMGGDEFLVVLDHGDQLLLEKQLETLELACIRRTIHVDKATSFVPTAAWGWSVKTEPGGVAEAIGLADQMMYQHKASLKRRRSDR